MQLEKAIYCMEMLASPGCNTALSGQPVKAAAGASLEVALTGWERVLPHRKNDWPKFFKKIGLDPLWTLTL